jgi:DNA polymerase III psi subunit
MQFIYLQQEPTQKMFADFFEKNLDWFLQTQQVIHEQVNATDSNPALADKAEVEASKQALWQDIEARFFKSLKSSLPEKDDL